MDKEFFKLLCILNKDIKDKFIKEYPNYDKFISDKIIKHETLLVICSNETPNVTEEGILFISPNDFPRVFPNILNFLKEVSEGVSIKIAGGKLINLLSK